MDNKKLKDIPPIARIAIVVLFACVIAPLIFHFKDITTWLAFWGNYVGALIGAMTTIIAFSYTHKQNKNQNEGIKEQNRIIQEQNMQIQEQNEVSKNMIEEQMRLQSLPFLNLKQDYNNTEPLPANLLFVDIDGNKANKKIMLDEDMKFASGTFVFTNIGVAPAIDVKIQQEIKIGHISVGEKGEFTIKCPSTAQYLTISTTYFDRENRKYIQTIEFTIDTTYKKLIYGDKIEYYIFLRYISSPKLINE